MVILPFVASFLLALAVSYVTSRLFRESAEAILSRFFAKQPPRGCRQVLAAGYRVRRRLERRQNPASRGLHQRSSLEPAGNGGPTHTGGMGAVDLPHSGRSPSGNRVVAPRVGLPGIRRAVLSPALEHERATGREGTRERHRGERTRRTDPLKFSGWFRSSARRRRPGRAPALLL
jgi:hypothetical protein